MLSPKFRMIGLDYIVGIVANSSMPTLIFVDIVERNYSNLYIVMIDIIDIFVAQKIER